MQVQNLEGLIHRNTVLCCVLLAPDLTYETHKPLQIFSTKKLGYAVIPCYKSTDCAYKLTMLAVQPSFDMSQEAGWAPRPFWTGAVNLALTGIRSPDSPTRSQLVYRLRYPAHTTTIITVTNIILAVIFISERSRLRKNLEGNYMYLIALSLKYLEHVQDP